MSGFVAGLFLLVCSAFAGERDALLQELDALRTSVAASSATPSELDRARALVREARQILGNAHSSSCRDVVFDLYRRVWSDNHALTLTLERCNDGLNHRGRALAWFHERTAKVWSLPSSLDRAAAYTKRVPVGGLDAVQYAYAITSKVWSSPSNLDRAVEYAARIPRHGLNCVTFAHRTTRAQSSEPGALELAISRCQ